MRIRIECSNWLESVTKSSKLTENDASNRGVKIELAEKYPNLSRSNTNKMVMLNSDIKMFTWWSLP